ETLWGTRKRRTGKILYTARTTGLEPATTGSTVRYSNQLSYVPFPAKYRHRRATLQESAGGDSCDKRLTLAFDAVPERSFAGFCSVASNQMTALAKMSATCSLRHALGKPPSIASTGQR